MSKLLKYTKGFDNNPNSDIAASKNVVKQYKKLLAKETLQPIIQDMNNQTKSVVTNLNDYSLLLKNITQNLVNAELYLSNSEVSKSKGAGRRLKGGMNDNEKLRTLKYAAKKHKVTNKQQAADYIKKEYADTGRTRMTKGDLNIMKAFDLYKGDDKGDKNIRGLTNAKTLLDRMSTPQAAQEDEIPDVLYGLSSKNSPASISSVTPVHANIRKILTTRKNQYLDPNQFGSQVVNRVRNMSDEYDTDSVSSENRINPLSRNRSNRLTPSQRSSLFSSSSSSSKVGITPKNLAEEEFYYSSTGIKPTDLDKEVEGDRFTQYPQESGIQGGDPKENIFENEEDNEEDYSEDYGDLYRDNYSAEKVRTTDELYNQQQEEDDDSDNNFDDFEQEDGEDFDLQEFINNQGHTPIKENFIITLFSNIINQLHKASDFWETNITPNLSDIPRLKMDSFIKSNAVNNFETAIEKMKGQLISKTIKTYLNYLDNIYHSLTNALDELFTKMNIDIKRYAGGLSSSSSNKPQLMGAGYLPFRGSVYSSHLRDSNTKYLM
jgi:hypothetical protein